MIELLFTVCLLGADMKPTDQCEPRSMQFAEENLTPYQCAMQAQPKLAEWVLAHPRYTITRYGCKPFNPNEKDA